ncbi:hypothetical protein [uncultured Kordia sp.]|uniref:hypothetical protein n=1 Tax=uncultured Kordia sp. TaxID=507699 RepID=UPI0026118EBB|nr:hypothetical protein [uncultured Kordia sp.]
MKTIFQKLSCVILLFSTMHIFGQTEKYEKETIAMNCFRNGFKDNGAKLENLIQKAETLLIEKKLLKDGSGESYLNVFKNLEILKSSETVSLGVADFILNTMVKAKDFSFEKYKSCVSEMMNETGFKETRINKNTEFLKSIIKNKGTSSISEIGNEISKMFTAEDFTHEYYKFLMITTIDNYYIKPIIQEVDIDELHLAKEIENVLQKDLTVATNLQIVTKGKSTLKVNNEEVSIDELKEVLKKHYQTHTFNSSVSLNVSGETMMSTVADIKEVISDALHAVRNEFALKKYKKPFDELTEKQQQKIKKMYPNNNNGN